MVETNEIEIQTEVAKVYKTPSYIRNAQKRYIENNPEKYKLIQKIARKKIYENKKAKGITPEEKEAKAKYMREYRAKIKLQNQN